MLTGVVPAREIVPFLAGGGVTHAGPPIDVADMCGPMRAAISTAAIAAANATPYGLAAYVWTHDLDAAVTTAALGAQVRDTAAVSGIEGFDLVPAFAAAAHHKHGHLAPATNGLNHFDAVGGGAGVEFAGSKAVNLELGTDVTATTFCIVANNTNITANDSWWTYSKAKGGLLPTVAATEAAAKLAC